jgi:enoyl-[acyl-carrier protein] reductase III
MAGDEQKALAGKTALVTGGSRGLGRVIALDLARRGADVTIQFFRNRTAAKQVVEEIQSHGVKASMLRCHFGKVDQIDALFTEFDAAAQRLDILIVNAASGVFRPVLELDEQAWDWTMNVSARAPLRCAQLAAARMEKSGGGRIVTIGSLGAWRTLHGYAMVGAAKGALDALTRYLAVELAPKGIIVNSVVPGALVNPEDDGEQWRAYADRVESDKDQVLSKMRNRTPIGQLTTPEQVANVVGWLSGESSNALVGQTIVVDGGFSLVS